MIVTIDGPAGAGKSTAARALARRLGFEFLDTGAMYRAVTWFCLQQGIDLADATAVAESVQSLEMRFDGHRVFAGGIEVTDEIRTPDITAASQHIAGNVAVRKQLVVLQQRFGDKRNIVTEGRDQGTIVFPHAECKFFVTAEPRERALRRQQEFQRRGQSISLEELLEQQSERDARDSARDYGGMKPAADAVIVDTTGLSHEQVVDTLERQVRERIKQ